MDVFFIYSAKVSICIIILYIGIKAFLSKETFFRFNRFALLIGIAVCLIIPFIHIEIEETSVIHQPMQVLENAVSFKEIIPAITEYKTESAIETIENTIGSEIYLSPEINMGNEVPAVEKISLSAGQIILIIYLVGALINGGILVHSFWKMKGLIKSGKRKIYNDYTLILTAKKICPFSWNKYIVLSEEDYQNNPDEIIAHELAHIKHRHSIDIILIEFVLLFLWFNPAMWLLKKELKDIHEYQADISVLKSGIDATKYQLLLVKKAVGASSYTLANSFNHSKIKKRITMMLKEKSNKWAKLKLTLLLPAATICMYAFAQPTVSNAMETTPVSESVTSLLEDKIVTTAETAPVSESTTILPKDEISDQQVYQDSKDEKIKALEKKEAQLRKELDPKVKEMQERVNKMVASFQGENQTKVNEFQAKVNEATAKLHKEMDDPRIKGMQDKINEVQAELQRQPKMREIEAMVNQMTANLQEVDQAKSEEIGTNVREMIAKIDDPKIKELQAKIKQLQADLDKDPKAKEIHAKMREIEAGLHKEEQILRKELEAKMEELEANVQKEEEILMKEAGTKIKELEAIQKQKMALLE